MRTGLLGILIAGALQAAPSLQPQQLRCEYRVNPQGFDVSSPRLSWILAAVNPKAHALHQSAYRVMVASSEQALRANTGDLWDSGRIESTDSIQIAYRGKPLASGAAAFWRVQ